MVPPPAIMARRERELAAARTAAEVDALQRRWDAEDDERERAEQVETQQLRQLKRENADLLHRVAKLERLLGPGGKMLAKQFTGAIADVMPRVLDRHLEHRRAMTYAGTWAADRSYAAGSTVTDKGSVWVALEQTQKGDRPGKGAPWKLAAKGEQKPGVA